MVLGILKSFWFNIESSNLLQVPEVDTSGMHDRDEGKQDLLITAWDASEELKLNSYSFRYPGTPLECFSNTAVSTEV